MTVLRRGIPLLLGSILVTTAAALPARAADPGTGSIVGTLTASDGTVRYGDLVDLWRQASDGTFAHLAYDYSGSYEFDGLDPGTYHVYFYRNAHQTGFWFPSSPDAVGAGDVVVTAGVTTTADGTSVLGAQIRGHVTTQQGRGVSSGVAVYRRDTAGHYERVPYDTSDLSESGGPDGAESTTFPAGSYDLTGLTAGTYRLYLSGADALYDRAHTRRPIWYGGAHSLATATDVVVTDRGVVRGVDQATASNAPVVVRRPVLRGRARVGGTLRVTKGQIAPGPMAHRYYTWYVGSREVASVHGPSIRLGANTGGKQVTVHVLAVPSAAAHYPTTPSRAADPITAVVRSTVVSGR